MRNYNAKKNLLISGEREKATHAVFQPLNVFLPPPCSQTGANFSSQSVFLQLFGLFSSPTGSGMDARLMWSDTNQCVYLLFFCKQTCRRGVYLTPNTSDIIGLNSAMIWRNHWDFPGISGVAGSPPAHATVPSVDMLKKTESRPIWGSSIVSYSSKKCNRPPVCNSVWNKVNFRQNFSFSRQTS